eukprot:1285201-Rhodomonas_salina.2
MMTDDADGRGGTKKKKNNYNYNYNYNYYYNNMTAATTATTRTTTQGAGQTQSDHRRGQPRLCVSVFVPESVRTPTRTHLSIVIPKRSHREIAYGDRIGRYHRAVGPEFERLAKDEEIACGIRELSTAHRLANAHHTRAQYCTVSQYRASRSARVGG